MNYLYCKWQAEKIQQLKDCGCEQHLTGLFADDQTHSSPATLKEIAFEYAEKGEITLTTIPVESADTTGGFFTSLYFYRFTSGLLRPPIA